MHDYDQVFKAYDIRGVRQDPIDGSFAYSIGRALAAYIHEEIGSDARLCFGADVRDANNEMIYYFLCGLEDEGFSSYTSVGMEPDPHLDDQDYFRGVCSSPVLYAATRGEFAIGVMFTASHNPPEYVGMKIVDRDLSLIPTTQLREMIDTRYQAPERDNERFETIWQRAMGDENELTDAVDAQLEDLTLMLTDRYTDIEGSYTIVIDYAGAAATTYERGFFEHVLSGLGHTIIPLNQKSDSDFSAHLADTSDPHEYSQLIHAVQEHQADLGIMFDGDADRLGVVDSDGRFVPGDIILAILIQALDQTITTSETIAYDVFCSSIVPETIIAAEHTPMRTRVGAALIKEICRDQGIILGGETSAHYLWRETGYSEMPLLALYYLLIALDTYESSAIMVDLFSPYHKPPMTNIHVDDPSSILQTIQKSYTDYDIDLTDGVRVNSDDRWFCVRASNTEPLIRIIMEAQDQQTWEREMEKLRGLLQ